mmetsp:Transcript_8239/g.12668  ORF Transcript_8239/g.12668 Transcript_8239/m.12668 type:complete len:86 (-) Transcript_8239:1112-1369(-)
MIRIILIFTNDLKNKGYGKHDRENFSSVIHKITARKSLSPLIFHSLRCFRELKLEIFKFWAYQPTKEFIYTRFPPDMPQMVQGIV